VQALNRYLDPPMTSLYVTKMQWLGQMFKKVWRGNSVKSGFVWVFVAEGLPPDDEFERMLSTTGSYDLIRKRGSLIRR
jgi:hypothetical protein